MILDVALKHDSLSENFSARGLKFREKKIDSAQIVPESGVESMRTKTYFLYGFS